MEYLGMALAIALMTLGVGMIVWGVVAGRSWRDRTYTGMVKDRGESDLVKAVIEDLRAGVEVDLWDGTCPECGESKWIRGPEAGIAQNLQCGVETCGLWVNMMDFGGGKMTMTPLPDKPRGRG